MVNARQAKGGIHRSVTKHASLWPPSSGRVSCRPLNAPGERLADGLYDAHAEVCGAGCVPHVHESDAICNRQLCPNYVHVRYIDKITSGISRGYEELAEREGFEPSIEVTPYAGLASRSVKSAIFESTKGYIKPKDPLSCKLTVSHDKPSVNPSADNQPEVAPDLAEVSAAWSCLPAEIKAAILTLARSARGVLSVNTPGKKGVWVNRTPLGEKVAAERDSLYYNDRIHREVIK